MRTAPPARGTRPIWGCLDNEEILTAAQGRGGDPNVEAHLSQCAECRRAVRDLARELGHRGRGSISFSGSSSSIYQAPRRRRLVARPGFWLILVLLALAGYGIKVFLSRQGAEPTPPASPPAEAAAAPAEQPVTAPARRKRAVRSRPKAPPQPSGQGQANNGEILATIRRNQGGVKACYERALKRDPNIASRLDVQVRIQATGAVENVDLGGSIGETELGACIRNNIKNWRFPEAREGYGAQFPLILVQRG
jgi:hypothetical protein